MWHYKTTDPSVAYVGYFDAASPMLRVGDFILVSTNIGGTMQSAICVVTQNTGQSINIAFLAGN